MPYCELDNDPSIYDLPEPIDEDFFGIDSEPTDEEIEAEYLAYLERQELIHNRYPEY